MPIIEQDFNVHNLVGSWLKIQILKRVDLKGGPKGYQFLEGTNQKWGVHFSGGRGSSTSPCLFLNISYILLL